MPLSKKRDRAILFTFTHLKNPDRARKKNGISDERQRKHADLFGFVTQTDSLALEPKPHITSRYESVTLQNADSVAIPYDRRLHSATPETSASSESVSCDVDGTTGSYNCQSDGYYSLGGGGYDTGDRFELHRPATSSLTSYVVKTDAHSNFTVGNGEVVILLNH